MGEREQGREASSITQWAELTTHCRMPLFHCGAGNSLVSRGFSKAFPVALAHVGSVCRLNQYRPTYDLVVGMAREPHNPAAFHPRPLDKPGLVSVKEKSAVSSMIATHDQRQMEATESSYTSRKPLLQTAALSLCQSMCQYSAQLQALLSKDHLGCIGSTSVGSNVCQLASSLPVEKGHSPASTNHFCNVAVRLCKVVVNNKVEQTSFFNVSFSFFITLKPK